MRKSFSAGGIVVNEVNEVVVVNQNNNSWSLPKGHIDKGEDALTAAKREIHEESGLDTVTYVKDVGSYERYRIGKDPSEEDKTDLKVIHMFIFSVEKQELYPLDKMHPEARWVPVDDVANLLTHPKDKEFFLNVKDQI